MDIPLESIRANRRQPRQEFDLDTINDLADSIRQSGVVQPLVVRPLGEGYELVAGERRLRASKIAGLKSVPCMVTSATDEQSLLMALVENIQRENLNAMDEAEAFAKLRDDFDLSQDAIAERVGKSRVAIANSLRLLNLPREMQEDLRDGSLTAGHARALLSIADAAGQRALWQEIKRRDLSVREAEERSREMSAPRPRQTSAFTGRPRSQADPEAARLSEELSARVGCPVTIHQRGPHRGRIELHYSSLEEFDRLLEALGLTAQQRL